MSSQNSDGDVTIRCSKEQAELIVKSLDVVSRLFMGQFSIVTELFRDEMMMRKPVEYFAGNIKEADNLLRQVKERLLPELSGNTCHGICSDDCPEMAKRCYWILKWISHGLHKDDSGYSVRKYPPVHVGVGDGVVKLEFS